MPRTTAGGSSRRSLPPLERFADRLRGLQLESGGPSVRELATAMRAAGRPFPRSTIADKLAGQSKPSWEFVEAFVTACARFRGERVVDLNEWRTAYGHLLRELATMRAGQRRSVVAIAELTVSTADPAPLALPRELPPDVRGFIGRRAELSALEEYVTGPDAVGTATTVTVISGTAGVGKTALAVHWSHRVANHFPHGQLYVDLRGYDPERPMVPGEVLPAFLRSLGVADQDIPYALHEQAARYRSLVAGRRLLVVLDNAHTVDQVRHLLPGSPGCHVLVTSRNSLTGLVARYGARRLALDRLPSEDAVGLLRHVVGARLDRERTAAAALAERCGGLPLALRIAAELVAERPTTSIDRVLDSLADERRRLDVLDAGADERTAVRAVFSWSFRSLAQPAARMFRLLALHPGRSVDLYAGAAIAATTRVEAGRLVDVLVRGHLLQRYDDGRLGLHDLLRAYARERLEDESDVDREAVVARLLDHYLSTAAAAMDAAFPAERTQRPAVPGSRWQCPPMADAASARAWLDAERANLVAVIDLAAERGQHAFVGDLATTLWRYLDTGAHFADALAVHGRALHVARRRGDRAREADALRALGVVHWRCARHPEALEHLRPAVEVSREAGDQVGVGRALNVLGLVYEAMSRYELAVDHFTQALAVARDRGERVGESATLANLGKVYHRWGRHEEAVACQRAALDIAREIGDRGGEGKILGNLGHAYQLQGRLAEAVACQREAIAVCHEAGDRVSEAWALLGLGTVHCDRGEVVDAVDVLGQALVAFEETGDRDGEAWALARLGDAHAGRREYEVARATYARAIALARDIGDRQVEAAAQEGLEETLLTALESV